MWVDQASMCSHGRLELAQGCAIGEDTASNGVSVSKYTLQIATTSTLKGTLCVTNILEYIDGRWIKGVEICQSSQNECIQFYKILLEN